MMTYKTNKSVLVNCCVRETVWIVERELVMVVDTSNWLSDLRADNGAVEKCARGQVPKARDYDRASILLRNTELSTVGRAPLGA